MAKKWLNPFTKTYSIRVRRYSEWISSDIAGWMAHRLPLRSKGARRALMLMRKMILAKIEEYKQPGGRTWLGRETFTDEQALDEARDEITTMVIDTIERGEADTLDWSLRLLGSP